MINSIVCGIDPGSSGAISYLDASTEELLSVQDMPVLVTRVGNTDRKRVNRVAVLAILQQAMNASCFIERPDARPMIFHDKKTGQTMTRQPGAAGMFAFGESYGVVIMGCTATNMGITEVSPKAWKRELSVPASKDDARRRAQELFPMKAALFERKKDDGRAESALLALYGARLIKQGRT